MTAGGRDELRRQSWTRLGETTRGSPAYGTIVVALVLAVGAAVVIGFVGAPAHEDFDWPLCAEIGTATGTILLAAYTAWLAATTRREVVLAIEEQRARDRPVVVGWPVELVPVTLDPTLGETIPAARVRLRNVGLGPSLDLEVTVSPQVVSGEVSREEVVAVLAVNEEKDINIALGEMAEPEGGFHIESFVVRGRYRDRTRTDWHPIIGLAERGIRDEQRAAERRANVRASLYLTPGPLKTYTSEVAIYTATVGNIGRGTAEDVTIFVYDQNGGFATEPIELGPVLANRAPVEIQIGLSLAHGPVTCTVQWVDGTGNQKETFGPFYGRAPS